MKSYIGKILVFFCMICILIGCHKEEPQQPTKPELDSSYFIGFTEPSFVFGFKSENGHWQNRYSYCPSVIRHYEGSCDVFFCGTLANQMVDNTYYIRRNTDGQIVDGPRVVLSPSLSWDSRHDCDPDVIQGEFKMNGKSYKYAQFFLSNPLEYYYNEIGVAFSNALGADKWDKYPVQLVKKTWDTEGDEILGGGGKSWGVGQPSAVSLDKKGKVLLTYTIGDKGGTRVVFTVLDMSDMSDIKVVSEVKRIPYKGLRDGTRRVTDVTCDADFAVHEASNRIYMIRPVVNPAPASYPNYIPSMQELDYMDLDKFLEANVTTATWTEVGRIDKDLSGFARNHNACIVRDAFGYIADTSNIGVYFTVSKESPEVTGKNNLHAEWTYHIYETWYKKEWRYFEKKK